MLLWIRRITYTFAIPGYSRIETKKTENIEKHQDLTGELRRLWNIKVEVIPVVVGALGTIPKRLGKNLKGIGIRTKVG